MTNYISEMDRKRSSSYAASIVLNQNNLPQGFPIDLYHSQESRYMEYWDWFTGKALDETVGEDDEGNPIYKFPLRINPINTAARKHAALLFGETADASTTMVRFKVNPKPDYGEDTELTETPESEKKLSRLVEGAINEVWMQSRGRTVQMEAGILSQFLGGSYFQLKYEPWRKDFRIPIRIIHLAPDFVIPVWRPDDPYNLVEAWIVYRIPQATAERVYNIKTDQLLTSEGMGNYAIYVEHWTPKEYSIYINGKAIQQTFADGSSKVYQSVKNPFGFVPIVYIPRMREGEFWGSSIVDDMKGLVKELNGQYAHNGDAVAKTVHRRNFGRNIVSQLQQKSLDGSETFIDLGQANPSTKLEPEIYSEASPTIPMGMFDHTKSLWQEILRVSSLSDISFGEDEGSQRSALTLAFRMWPSTSFSRWQRSHWAEGLEVISRMILDMMIVKGIKINNKTIDKDYSHRVDFLIDWYPMIPRDREQQINEVVLLVQTGVMSPKRALETLGDVDDIPQEIQRIKDWMEYKAELAAPDEADGQAGEGAATEIESPVATSDSNESL